MREVRLKKWDNPASKMFDSVSKISSKFSLRREKICLSAEESDEHLCWRRHERNLVMLGLTKFV